MKLKINSLLWMLNACFMRRYITLCFLAILLFQFKSMAQNSPLSDTWILFDQVSISGPLYSNALPRMTKISFEKDHIVFESLDMNGQGMDTTIRDTSNLTRLYNRKYRANRYKEVESKLSADGRELETVTLIYPDTEKSSLLFRITSKYTTHGRQMILQRKFENTAGGENWECRGVFEKRDNE